MTTDLLGIIAPHPPIMVPEVGLDDADITASSAESLNKAAALVASYNPETIILMSPHAPMVLDAFAIDDSTHLKGTLAAFGAPTVGISALGDPDLAHEIMREAAKAGLKTLSRSANPRLEAGYLDHGAIVPLSFLDRNSKASLIEISLSTVSLADHRTFGSAIYRAVKLTERRAVFLASGDCSHRLTRSAAAGWSPRGAEFDAELVRLVREADFKGLVDIDPDLVEEAGECGLRSFVTLGGFFESLPVQSKVLSYEGPWGVGYLTAVVASPAIIGQLEAPAVNSSVTPDESSPVALARRTIETYLRQGYVISPPAAEGLLAERHGAFVSLHRNGDLRGCIGTIEPTQTTLAEEIIRNAIEAATADPRFPAMQVSELDGLEISVDVLHEPQSATIDELDPRIFGVIVSSGYRRGLLLPDLEGVDTVETQVDIARAKAGIQPGTPIALERFRVDRYH